MLNPYNEDHPHTGSQSVNWIARGVLACDAIFPKFDEVGDSVGPLNSGCDYLPNLQPDFQTGAAAS